MLANKTTTRWPKFRASHSFRRHKKNFTQPERERSTLQSLEVKQRKNGESKNKTKKRRLK